MHTPGLVPLLIILVLAFLLFGRPGRLSGMMEDLGKGIKGFRKGMSDSDKDTKPEEPPRRIVDQSKSAEVFQHPVQDRSLSRTKGLSSMLPGLGFQEILLLGVIALLVVGPKDLPVMLRELGKFTRKLQGMAAEFRQGFDELARQAELDELRKEVDAMRAATRLPDMPDLETALTGPDQPMTSHEPPPAAQTGPTTIYGPDGEVFEHHTVTPAESAEPIAAQTPAPKIEVRHDG